MKIQKTKLLLLAALVWIAAGFNILRIGVLSYQNYTTALNLMISAVVFLIFWFMVFGKLVKKHTHRIIHYKEERQFFLKFFDVKSFCIMAFMMTFGIGLRVSGICPDVFIAVFYSGLGAALTLAGILFGYHYLTQLKKTATESPS
ncbi:hypothetical protein HGO97_003945 [Faecalicatena sp. AGMB00832]|uniref:Transmembrane protein n=1 Tax=Faecalicatena faecalis TaxID=2726362 RepID=A0ABS6D0D7_9FIRM|nr:hypothetical protein [Faecalicatena faecalis]MBU3874965.1 hypothetical protein [Faecalicatena faecalis]